jgi:hypothetical protein
MSLLRKISKSEETIEDNDLEILELDADDDITFTREPESRKVEKSEVKKSADKKPDEKKSDDRKSDDKKSESKSTESEQSESGSDEEEDLEEFEGFELLDDLDSELTRDSDPEKTEAEARAVRKRRRGAMLYRVFLLSWVAALLIVMCVFLGKFYDYLDKFETDYRASQPEVITEDLMVKFRTADVQGIYDLLAVKPVVSEYESNDDVLSYMRPILEQGDISFSEDRAESSEEHPVYNIRSGDAVIARAEYEKIPKMSESDIPAWKLVYLDLPFGPEESVDIVAPENVSIYLNGLLLPDNTVTSEWEIEEAGLFFDEFTQIPQMTERQYSGLYYEPEVVAIGADGSTLPVIYDEYKDRYEIGYPRTCPDMAELEEFATKVISTYASFVSGDRPESELRKYFTPNNEFLYYMTHAGLTYFTRHLAEEIHSTEVLDFIRYSDDAFYCEVKVEQYLTMEWGPREPEILITDGKFYFVNLDGEWKVSGIEF